MNITDIFSSWVTALNPNDVEVELAKKRLAICNSCEFKREVFKNQNWSITCKACGCPIKVKIFSKEENSCPENKWVDLDKDYPHLFKNKKNISLL
jgi:hypothetical protein